MQKVEGRHRFCGVAPHPSGLHMLIDRLSLRAKVAISFLKTKIKKKDIFSWGDLKQALEKSGGIGSQLLVLPSLTLDISDQAQVTLSSWLEESFSLAQEMSHFYVGTEHLLLGFLSLADFSQLDTVKEALLSLGDYPKEASPSGKSAPSPAPENFFSDISNSQKAPSFCTNLTDKAIMGELPMVVERPHLLDQIYHALLKKDRCHPLLIGPLGCGKTSLINSLAYQLISYKIPRLLLGTTLLKFNWGEFLASSNAQHNPLGAFSSVMESLAREPNSILVLDDLHLLGSLSSFGSKGVSVFLMLLKESLDAGLRVIASADLRGLESILDNGLGLEQYFQSIDVGVWSNEELLGCLDQLLPLYENYHKVELNKGQLKEMIDVFERYLPEEGSLSRILDVVDRAGASANLERCELPSGFAKKVKQFEDLSQQCFKALESRDMDLALTLRQKRDRLGIKLAQWQNRSPRKKVPITKQELLSSLSSFSGVPVSQLSQSELQRYLSLEKELAKKVIGQSEAISAISQALKKARLRLNAKKRPIGNFLFLGPTGVGKTHLARVVASTLFGPESFLKLDMSGFGEKHTVSRLIGAPPGYIGYEEGGELVDFVNNHPYSVILFDEIDKAHPDILNILLQIMEDGVLTDGQGRAADFSNCVIILTSNHGSALISQARLGFSSDSGVSLSEYNSIKDRLLENLKGILKPEFLNRLDQAIVFGSLNKDALYQICSLEVENLNTRFKEHNLCLKILPTAKNWLVNNIIDQNFGARPLRRLLEEKVVGQLSEMLLKQQVPSGSLIRIKEVNNNLVLQISPSAKRRGRPVK